MMKYVLLKYKGLSLMFGMLVLFFCLILVTVCVAEPVKLSLDEQEQLARQLYTFMSNTDESDTDTFIKLHRQVIDQCPDTKRAIESLWRLSNLYLLAKDPPDNQKIIELMEYLFKRYPDAPIVPNAKKRLLVAYKDTGNMKKVVELYDEAFGRSPKALEDPEISASILEYADALAKTGNKKKARTLYQKIIGFGDKVEDWLLDIAKSKLEELEAGAK